jgi:hypothetical protein
LDSGLKGLRLLFIALFKAAASKQVYGRMKEVKDIFTYTLLIIKVCKETS